MISRRLFNTAVATMGLMPWTSSLRAQPVPPIAASGPQTPSPAASAGAASTASGATGAGSNPSTSATLETVLRERARFTGMGYAAAHLTPQGVTLGFAGRRSAADERPPTADDGFEIGSITKTFTALLLADAVVRRELALDDPVETTLGQKLRDAESQPLRWIDLATHRSGLPRLPTNFSPRRREDPYANYDEPRLRDFIEGWRPAVPRQQRWEYSNLGVGLMGFALGRALGKPYPALLADRVLKPLGLDDLRLSLAGAPDRRVLPGHTEQGQPVPNWTFDTLAGAGALVGPITALVRFAQAALGLVDHPLAPAFALCLRRHADGGSPANAMGLAWILGELRGRPFATHDGSTFGFASSLFLEPQRRHATIVLANARGGVGDLAVHLIDPVIPPRNLEQSGQTLRFVRE